MATATSNRSRNGYALPTLYSPTSPSKPAERNGHKTSQTPPASHYAPKPDWQDDADCSTLPFSVFFGSGEAPMSSRQVESARQICNRCPVKTDCLFTALQKKEQHGVWGGLSPRQRSNLMKDAKGDPLKALRILLNRRQPVGR